MFIPSGNLGKLNFLSNFGKFLIKMIFFEVRV